jgi:hypothetical protein
MDHGDSVVSSANNELVEAAADVSSPKSDFEVSGVAAGGEESNRDMLERSTTTR